MNRPLITHDDNYGTDYHYDNKKDEDSDVETLQNLEKNISGWKKNIN